MISKFVYEDVKKKKYSIDLKRIARLLRQYGSLPKVSLIVGIPYSLLYPTLKQKLGINFRQFMHQFKRRHIRRLYHKDKMRAALKVPKNFRIGEGGKEYVCETVKLIKLFEEHRSLQKVSEITNIPYSVLYNLFKIKLNLDVPRKAKKTKYKYNIDKLVRLFKKYGFLPPISKITGIPSENLHRVLTKHFGMGLYELRRKLKGRKTYFRDTDKSSFRYQQVKDAYERLGTLEKAGKELGLTRQRVSQILLKGKRIGLFSYERKGGNLKILKRKLTREILIKDIELLLSETKICLKYNINKKKLKSLLRYFNIDFKEYQRATRAGKYIQWYSKIVDSLGYHPTTTELNTRPEWNKVWKGIGRHWGSFDNFRKEFGIQRPEHRFPKQLLERFEKARLRRLGILGFLKENLGQMSNREISLKLGINLGQLYNYISKFRKEDMLPKSDIYRLRKNGELGDAEKPYKKIVRRRGSGEERRLAVLNLIKENNKITAVEIARKLDVHRSRVYEAINELHIDGRLAESNEVPWKRRTTKERKNVLLNIMRESNSLNVREISKQTGIPVYSVYRYIRELRKDGKIK